MGAMTFLDGVGRYLGQEIEYLTFGEDSDGNVFIDWIPETPAQAIGIFSLPGLEADSGLPYDPAEFQIIVRGDAGTAVAASWAAEVYSLLHGLAGVTMPDGTYVVFILAQQSTPHRIGDDDNGRPRYSIDFRSEILNPTTHRP